jgi:integrase
MASVERRVDRQGTGYRVRYRDMADRQRSRTFRRKIDAQQFADAVEADKTRGTFIDPRAGKQTFADFADEWAAAQGNWKATTRESWTYTRARLVELIGDRAIGSIDLLTLQALQQALSERYSRATVVLTMSYAGAVMRAAFTTGRIGRDPTRGLRSAKARAGEPDGKVGPDDVPTRSEALAILAGAPDRYRAAIALGLSGLRVGEVLGMSADRVDLEHRLVTVDRQLQRVDGGLVLTTPKAERTRTIAVPAAVSTELARHIEKYRADELLFHGGRGALQRRDEFYRAAWRPALVAAGLRADRFVFHSLRHFCASSLLAEGAPLAAVAGHLGDTVETVSRTYVHWLRDDRGVPAEVLARILENKPS